MYDPDLQTFRLFLTVHELGNITRAAERSNIAVSAVTKRLQDLEAHYHVRLFDRQPRGVRPTAAGDALAHDIRDLLARLDRLKGTMSEFAEGVRGHVQVHASASNILENLAEAIAEFTRTNPLIRIEVQEAMSWSIVRDVLEGRADIGLISASIEIPPSLTVYAYRTDQLVAVLPRNHLLAQFKTLEFDQLLDYEHVGIGANSALTVQLEEAAAMAIEAFATAIALSPARLPGNGWGWARDYSAAERDGFALRGSLGDLRYPAVRSLGAAGAADLCAR